MAAGTRVFRVPDVAGLVQWQLLSDRENTVWIDWIEVDAPGHGRGTTLLRAFEDAMREDGIKAVRFLTVINTTEAMDVIVRRFQFFQKHAYNFVGLERIDIPTEGMLINFTREKRL